ncbi:hypothetical protein YC2023_036382 [Brassica napus]
MSNNENVDDVGAGAEDGGGTTRCKMSILGYTWKVRYRQKLPKEAGKERICKEFLEKTGISLPWDSFKSKYDTLRNITVAYWLRFKGFYTQVWGSNPKLCNLLQITGNPGFKSGDSGLLNNYADYIGKACKGSSIWGK